MQLLQFLLFSRPVNVSRQKMLPIRWPECQIRCHDSHVVNMAAETFSTIALKLVVGSPRQLQHLVERDEADFFIYRYARF